MKKTPLIAFIFCLSAIISSVGNVVYAQAPVENPCSNISAGSIAFTDGSARITPGMKGSLANLAAQMQYSPECKLVVMGNAGGSKLEQQLSWDRVNAVIEYMGENHNIDRNRFVFWYQSPETPISNVAFRYAQASEYNDPSSQAPPHPDLRKAR